MKKNISAMWLLLLLSATGYTQGVSKLFGLVGGNVQANQSSNGFLFSTDSTGQGLQVKYDFPVTVAGAMPAALEMMPYNGKLYGTTVKGGASDYGTLFEYDPVTNSYTKKIDFGPNVAVTGGSPKGSLLLYNNKFYGLAADYALNGGGCIFEWDPATNIYTKRYEFNGTAGQNPQNSLRLLNGKMYGTTLSGGSANLGVVFEWDPVSNACNKLYELTGPNGRGFYNNVTVFNNRLYAMSHQGGANDYGAMYVIDPALPYGANTTIIKQFDATGGGSPNNNEMIVYNSKLYGCLYSGGTNFSGVLFELNPVGNVYTKLVDFEYASRGRGPLGKLVLNGTKFLGMCSEGGANGTGTLYEWDPANPSTIVKKADFSPNNFDSPVNPGSTLTVYNSKIYGVTYNGGFVNQGTMFEFNYATGSISKKLTFNAAENGRIPFGKPVLLNGKIYGVCYQGPQEIFGTPYGCLWQFDPSTNVYTRKFLFNNLNNAANGRAPVSAPVAYNGKLYGTTNNGGTGDVGVLYEFDPSTDAYSKKDMQAIGGSFPVCEPTLYNNKFYGMTNANGAGNLGIVYSYDPATATLVKLYDVQNSGSRTPAGGFTVYNNKLYGTTSSGGPENLGGIIIYDPAANSAITVPFTNANGQNVANAPTLYNGKFYLTAVSGGTGGRGTIMQFDPSNNNLTKIHDFNTTAGGNGYDPKGELTVSGDKLYFITQEGNTIVNVLELNPSNNSVAKKSSITVANLNVPVTHNGLTVVPAFIANGIANNCETYPTVIINASNNNRWVPILNAAGDVVAEIKANGNNLGNVTAAAYINSGPVREDGQRKLYADRNLTISVQNNTITGSVDLRLYMKKSEFDSLKNAVNSLGQPSGITTIGDIAVYKNNQPCAAAITTDATKLVTSSAVYEYGYVLTTSVTSFSGFYFARNTFTVLPVTLVNFTAVKQSTSVKLDWATENEINFSKFEVEKSIDATRFSSISTVAAANRPSNNYSSVDGAPAKGYNYYRLKMTDNDGRVTYSHVKKINFEDALSLTIWPNPAGNSLMVKEAKPSDKIVILDAKGSMVFNRSIATLNQRLDISQLPAGIYILKLLNGGKMIQSTFMKQ